MSYIEIKFVPHRKRVNFRYEYQPVSAVYANITAYCENHRKHTNILCEYNVEF
jgi:hypothetical protein